MKTTFFKVILDSLFPPRCIFCDEIVTPNVYFCKNCIGTIERPNCVRCLGCGLSKKDCECNEFIYHFDAIVSPFYNLGNAKRGYYKFKFEKNHRAGEYYADRMADTVKRFYSGIKFDFITSVCSSNPKTNFDHSGILAEHLSERLGIKYVKTLKPSGKKRVTQHKLGLNDRFENIHNAYSTIAQYKGKRILLVDDIKTSGATIDECARQLKLTGADSVYCVTALVGTGQKAH